jgi:hypothetical protein
VFDRFGVLLMMLAGFANAGWLILEDGPRPPLHQAQGVISLGLIALAATALGIEIHRVAQRRSSGLGLIGAVFGLLFALFVGAIVCCLRLPGPAV